MTLPVSWGCHRRRTTIVRVLPVATALLLVTCAVGLPEAAAASARETNKAGVATGRWLVKNGQADSAIVLGADSDPFHAWIAGELQRYIKSLSGGEPPIVSHDKTPPDKALLILGGPQVNPLCAAAQQQQMVSFAGLKPEGFVLKTVELDGRPTVIVGGNDEAGTMYAAYELLERLGVVFQLTGDIIPQRKPDLPLPALDVRMEPVLKYRGMHCCHGLRWHMGLADFRKHIDQLAKLKLNCLQFYAGIGSPWVEFSYAGKVGEILYPKESGYVAWGFGLSTSGTAKEMRVGRECFPQEYLGPPEFAHVQTQQEAFATAREFLHEVIQYAHQRKVQVWLMMGEIPYVPPNLAPPAAKHLHDFYCGVALPIGDPTVLGVWEAAVRSMMDTYPRADAYGIWTSELFFPVADAQTQALVRQHAAVRKLIPSLEEIHRQGNVQPRRPEHLDCDLAEICVAAELVKRIRRDRPAAKLGVSVLFRPYLFRALDSLLPKDVWLMSMETWANTAPVMHFYGDIAGRELLVMPRIDDDGCELHMQLNASMYDHDEIIPGSVRYKVAGLVGQLNKERGLECNVRYVAEGAWDPDIHCRSFYEGYLRRLYGPDGLDVLLKAYLMLEENDKALGWHGRRGIFPGFCRFSPCRLRTDVNYKEARPKVNQPQLDKEINAAAGARTFWRGRTAHCRQALDLLKVARPRILAGSQAELDYVTFKMETFILYFEVLDAVEEARAALDRAWLAKGAGNTTEFNTHLAQSKAALDRADRLAAQAAREMIAYRAIPTERYLLFRFNQNVIGSIEAALDYVNQVLAFQNQQKSQ
ncbi:MAG: hypothetical protein JXQ73_28665 [Phycisphaerae bacterium]|nr:hypothetical protein [Phycisphaerae bacterium]